MIAYSPSSTAFLKAAHPVVPDYLISVVQTVTDIGSSNPIVDDDANLLELEGATLLNEAQITAYEFADITFTSLDTGIATIDSTGRVTRVSNGTARIMATVGPDKQQLRVGVSLVDPAETTIFASWVGGSAAKYAHDTITALAGTSSDRAIFTGSGRNPSLFCSEYASALTAIAKTANGSSHYGFTAITPRHVVSCSHIGNYVGATLVFVDADGNSLSRTITHLYAISGADIYVYLLNSDLPAEISPMSVMPANMGDFIRNPQYRFNLLFADRDNLINIGGSSYFSSTSFRIDPPAESLSEFYTTPVVGTSGKPVFIPVSSTEVALVLTFTGQSGGPSYHSQNWPSIIAALDASAGVATGHAVSTADLSAFTNFSP